MKASNKIAVFIISVIILASCSPSKRYVKVTEKPYYETTMELATKGINCWVQKEDDENGRFNISGKIFVPKSNGYNYKNVQLNEVRILQNDKEFFFIKPITRSINSSSDNKEIQFSTIKGIEIDDFFNTKRNIDILFVLEEAGDEFFYLLKNIKIKENF